MIDIFCVNTTQKNDNTKADGYTAFSKQFLRKFYLVGRSSFMSNAFLPAVVQNYLNLRISTNNNKEYIVHQWQTPRESAIGTLQKIK